MKKIEAIIKPFKLEEAMMYLTPKILGTTLKSNRAPDFCPW